MSLVTSSVKWLTIALLTASLAACGASDSGSSPATATVAKTTESNTAKDTQSVKAGIHFPKFSEIRFSTPVSTGGSTATSVLKAVNKSAGLVGGYLYPQYVWNSHRINVCWVNPTGWDEQEREWTREAVTGTWDANSDVTFVDWTQCPEYDLNNPNAYLGVRIGIYSDRPKANYGETNISFRNGALLNLDFATWGGEATNDCRTTLGKAICIKNAAIHEFGHILAFIHEQDRSDTSPECIEQVQKDEPDYPFSLNGVVFGPWDMNSIMNYCSPAGFYKTPRGLTAGDITMLQKYYGKPGSKIYSVLTANDPPIVSIQDSKTFEDVADYLTIPNAQASVLRHFYATLDGNKVAYTLFNQQKGSSVLGYIDTRTDTLKGQKAIAEEIIDMKVSGDSKYAYVVWKQNATGGLRAYDLSTLAVAWDLPLTGASQIVGQRLASSQRIYVVKNSGGAQSISVLDVNSHTQVASYAVGTTRMQPLVVGLTPDERTLYLVDPGPDNQLAPFIASLDTQSGQYNVLQPISPADASVHELHVLDSNQVVLGTNKQGISPLLYTVSANSFSALTGGVPGDWSLPYVYSPDGKTIFSMGQYWDGKIPYYTFIRLDSYRLGYATTPVVWDGSNHPVISAGFGQDVVTRPFAVIYR